MILEVGGKSVTTLPQWPPFVKTCTFEYARFTNINNIMNNVQKRLLRLRAGMHKMDQAQVEPKISSSLQLFILNLS